MKNKINASITTSGFKYSSTSIDGQKYIKVDMIDNK